MKICRLKPERMASGREYLNLELRDSHISKFFQQKKRGLNPGSKPLFLNNLKSGCLQGTISENFIDCFLSWL